MRRRWPALAGAVAVLAAGTAGCAEGGEQLRSVVPYCDNFGALILEAQSVPSTQLVPCLEALPLGWTVAEADVDADGSRIVLDSDRGGESAVVVTLEETCVTGDAIQVPTDEPETRQYEMVQEVVGGYRAVRHYRHAGGCTTYSFDLEDEASAALVTESSGALTFVTRDEVDAEVREVTEGRLGLDPE